MIARIAYFEGLSEAQLSAMTDNYERRFKAALVSQPGLLALYQLQRDDGTRVSVSVWESREASEAGGRNANSVPLLPGQVGADIPSPTRMELLEVANAYVAPSAVSAGPA